MTVPGGLASQVGDAPEEGLGRRVRDLERAIAELRAATPRGVVQTVAVSNTQVFDPTIPTLEDIIAIEYAVPAGFTTALVSLTAWVWSLQRDSSTYDTAPSLTLGATIAGATGMIRQDYPEPDINVALTAPFTGQLGPETWMIAELGETVPVGAQSIGSAGWQLYTTSDGVHGAAQVSIAGVIIFVR